MPERDLNDIEVFAKVVEQRSFTGAGRLLNMPRSTVSRRIAELERRLGVRLLHRTTRKLRLTDLGGQYYERCASGLSTIDEAEACVLAASEEPRGKVRLTGPFSLESKLGEALASFLAQYADVQIEVELTQRMVDLIGENFDLAIRATGHLPDSSLVARQLATGDAALFASRDYLAAHAPIREPEDLAAHDVLTFQRNQRTWTLFDENNEATEVAIRPRLVANDPSLAMTAAEAGAGIALLPFDTARQDLCRVLPQYRGRRASLYLVYPSAKLMSATLRTLRDHLITHFGSAD